MEKVLEQLKVIAGKTANKITREDKDLIRQYAGAYGVVLPKDKPNCKSCYVDAAVQIWKAIKAEQGKPTDRKWVLKDGVDVIWRGIRINEASCTDEMAEKWIAGGFPKIYFK